MTPQHHLDEAVLLEHAAGTASEALSLLVACHLTLCPTCRQRSDALDALGATLLDGQHGTAGPDDALARMLARLDEPAPPTPDPAPPGEVLPAALRRMTGPLDQLAWRRHLPGVRRVDLPLTFGEMPVRLFELSPGLRIPLHAHETEEYTLVFTGGFSDEGGHYQRGDVCLRTPGPTHRQVIDPGEPCVALVLLETPLVPRSPVAWLTTWFVRS